MHIRRTAETPHLLQLWKRRLSTFLALPQRNCEATHQTQPRPLLATQMLLAKNNDPPKGSQISAHWQSSPPPYQLCRHTAFCIECNLKVTRTGRNHSNVTAAFPIAAQSSVLCQHIFYSEDCGFILVVTTKLRSAQDLLAAAQQAYKFFED